MPAKTIESHRNCIRALIKIPGSYMSIQRHKDAIRGIQQRKRENP